MACTEHQINFRHITNKLNFLEIFNGGETKIWAVTTHNVHKNMGKLQEGGALLMMFGPLIEHLNGSGSKKDESRLGRWVVMKIKEPQP